MQVNHPPPEPPKPYVRPGRLTYVVPARVRLPIAVGVSALLLGVLLLAGMTFDDSILFCLLAGFASALATDEWWRRNRPPSEDRGA